MKRATLFVLSTALFGALPALLTAQSIAENKLPSAHSKKADDPFLNGAPFTFDQVLKLVGDSPIPLHRRKDAIQARGIDFALGSEELDKLKAAGANDDVLELIKSKAKVSAAATAHVAPKPAPTGGIALNCSPGECDISLNGKSIGPTLGGKLEVSKLTPGKWVVDFKKDGYLGHQNTATIEADKVATLTTVLEPNKGTLEAYGTALFKKMIQAVGGDDAVQALASVQAVGSTTIWTHDGTSVRWTLLMRNRPDRALFQARAGNILHEVSFIGSQYNNSKNLKGADALELPTHFGFIRDAMLAAVITRLQNPEFKIMANHALPAEGDEYTLFAENSAEKVSIGLDDQSRPVRVKIATTTGVGSAAIAYSEYFKGDRAYWPKSVQIKPDGWQHGIDVRFDTMDLGSHLSESDFKMRGKPLANIGN
ncbi:MAG TPA: PEGA domain-containing protein [Bryobacteraceae bacterium]|nr:PEGA domain-containing protein [Bryobacteraceae bacterium]